MVRTLSDQFYLHYIFEHEKTYQYSVRFKRNKVTFDIIETRGKNNAIISHADAVFVVFSITDMESYVHAKEVVKRVKGVTFSGDTPIVLIANKRDKENQRCVGKQE